MKTSKVLLASALFLALGCATTEAAKPAPAPAPKPAEQKAAPPAAPAQPLTPPPPEDPFRDQKPAALPTVPKFEAPAPAIRKLKNGAELWVIENHAVPLVAIEVRTRTGVNAEPIDKAGLADLMVSMLDEGTKTRSATELAAALEDLAAELTGAAGREDMQVHMNSLAETLPQALDLFADVLQNPAYRPEDLERMRGLKITALEQKRGMPPALASDEASRLLFGDKHPWGQPSGGTPETLKRITQADLVKFHDTWVRPNNSVIVVAGDVTPDGIAKLLEERFAGWKAKPLPKLNLPPWPKLERAVSFTDKPNTTQSQVWVVGRLFPAADPDTIPFQTANFAFGGLFTSRLNLDLREEKGYTYGARSRLSFSRTFGVMASNAGIVAKNTAEALVEFENQLDKYAKGGLEADELARSKEAFTRTLPSMLETDDALAGAFAGASVSGLGPSYYRELPGKIAAVTLEDVLRVVKHVTPASWPIVIVGPAAENADKVKALNLGPVTVKPVPGGAPATGH